MNRELQASRSKAEVNMAEDQSADTNNYTADSS